MKRTYVSLWTAALLCALFLSCFALPGAALSSKSLTLQNGKTLSVLEKNGEPFVSLYALALAQGGDGRYDWRTRSMTVTVLQTGVRAVAGETRLTANGKEIPGSANFISSNILYVPASSAAKAFGQSLTKAGGAYRFAASSEPASGTDLPEADLFWLARIIESESAGQPYAGQLAVGTVVMNRVASREFPDTVYAVIFDDKYGVQFTPAATGAVYCTPGESSVKAAKAVLAGYRTDDGILYFMNESISTSGWMRKNRPFAFSIGDHSFFR